MNIKLMKVVTLTRLLLLKQFSDDDDDDRGRLPSSRHANRGVNDSPPLASNRSEAGKPPSGRLPTMSRENSKPTIEGSKKPLAITYSSTGKSFGDSDDSFTDSRFTKSKSQTSNYGDSKYDKYDSKYDK